MPRRKVSIIEVARVCRERGSCSEGEIALWFDLSPTLAYYIWRELRQVCGSGLLDAADLRCEVEGERIVFRKRGE